MKIDDLVLYQGRPYYLRGFDPMSVSNRQAFLEDALTGEEISAPMDELEPGPSDEPPHTSGVRPGTLWL